MGMFDNVDYKCDCPSCGKEVDDFQSKDGDCILITIPIEKVNNFYTMCLNCNEWIEFFRISPESFEMKHYLVPNNKEE